MLTIDVEMTLTWIIVGQRDLLKGCQDIIRSTITLNWLSILERIGNKKSIGHRRHMFHIHVKVQ
jgi:hypothetical protein